jgi:hypothetical protein
MLVSQALGMNPWGHHLLNVLLHALNAALVFAWLRQMTGAGWRSLCVAALFAVHPLRVEAVAWVTERREVLCACFGLLALMAYVRYAKESLVRSPWSVVRGRWSVWYLLSLFFLALGLMSKPTLVTWPFVMLLLDYWPLRRMQKAEGRRQNAVSRIPHPVSGIPDPASATTHHVTRIPPQSPIAHRPLPILWRLVWEKIPFFVLVAAESVVLLVVQARGGGLGPGKGLSLGAHLGNALISYCRYLGKMLWPANLAVAYPHPGHWPGASVLLAGGLLLAISALVWVQRHRYPYLLMGWLWYCVTLVPMSQMVQTGSHAMADRWNYLPCLGVLIMAVWGAYELVGRWQHRVLAWSVAGVAVILACLPVTRHQIGYWKDGETLFRHALEVTENNAIAHEGLGVALDNKGQIDEAIGQFQESVRLKPSYGQAHYNLGVALFQRGRTDEAIFQFQEALRLNPNQAEAHNNLGAALGRKGRTDEAIHEFQEALRLKPDHTMARKNLNALLATNAPAALRPGGSRP